MLVQYLRPLVVFKMRGAGKDIGNALRLLVTKPFATESITQILQVFGVHECLLSMLGRPPASSTADVPGGCGPWKHGA